MSNSESFDDWLNSEGNGHYIKLKRDIPTIIRLKNNGKPIRMDKKRLSKDPSAEKVLVAVYIVTTPDDPTTEKEWSVSSKRLARQLHSQTERGFREFEVIKRGEGMQTTYDIIPRMPPTAVTSTTA